MEFKEFKELYFGKSIEYIKEELKKDENFFKTDIDMIKLCIDANDCANKILEMDKAFPALYLFKKKYAIMLYILEELTNLEMIPEDESFEDYDAFVEKAILELNSHCYFFKQMVEEIILENKSKVISDLYETFEQGLPSVEQMQELRTSIKDVFADETPENLKMIEDIMAYNDPTMKSIKDIVTTTVDIEQKANDANANESITKN